jgi:spore germination protein YaaH
MVHTRKKEKIEMNKGLCKKLRILCILIAAAAAIVSCSQMKRETQTDLQSFYELLSDKEYVVLLDGENIGKAYKDGEEVYLPYELVHDNINDKFYLDEENNRILYTTADNIETFDIGADSNTISGEDGICIALSCIKERTQANCQTYTEPNRVAIFTQFGEVTVCKPKKDTVIRQYNQDGADYMAKVSKGESLTIKEQKDSSWYRVVKDNGITGYIKIEETGGETTENRTCDTTLPEYSHLTMDEIVCMGWHQVEGTAGNDTLESVTADAKGILNVISPTWLKLTDTQGNISSGAQSSYVEKAHNMGMKVWVLADDFSYGEDGTYYVASVLGNFESRQNLIQNLVNEVINCGADGINIDYEKIYEDIADDYIEFIRELSIECRKNGLVLSVDTYVEQSYNAFYNRAAIGEAADYLVIMGYDEHWAGGSSAGSVASLTYVKQGIDSATAVVDAKRVINGIPFYTRIWSETKEGYGSEGTFVEDAANGNYWLTSSAVGMEAAENDLNSHGATLTWLEDIGQYYGEYTYEGGTTRVWLEEERSIQAKLDVMKTAEIGGVACWKLGLEKSGVWSEIAAYIQ